MKKLLLIAIVAIAFCGAANAQLGITGGGNLAKYKIKDDGDRKAIFSWKAGLFYRIKSKHSILAVQPALTFTGKGADKYNDPFSNNDIEKYSNRLSYVQLSVPVLLSATDIEGTGIGIDFGIGPFFSRLV